MLPVNRAAGDPAGAAARCLGEVKEVTGIREGRQGNRLPWALNDGLRHPDNECAGCRDIPGSGAENLSFLFALAAEHTEPPPQFAPDGGCPYLGDGGCRARAEARGDKFEIENQRFHAVV